MKGTMGGEGRTTLAEVRAAPLRRAPMRLATRVDAAMDRGKGMLKVVEVTVTMMLCAARWALPNWLEARVRTSKAKYCASTMIMPGRASLIMGPVGG